MTVLERAGHDQAATGETEVDVAALPHTDGSAECALWHLITTWM